MTDLEADLSDDFDPFDLDMDRARKLLKEASEFSQENDCDCGCMECSVRLVQSSSLIKRLVEELVRFVFLADAWRSVASDKDETHRPLTEVLDELDRDE